MPKVLNIDPTETRKPGYITFRDIPFNQYSRTIEEEKANFTNADFIRIFRDMAYIREFETMLNMIKTMGEYNGVVYNNPGPAHLSIGQEASAVGQAYILDKDDYIFGSHRSHGEFIAKALACIEKMSDDELMGIMKSYAGGRILKIVENSRKHDSVKDLAVSYTLYGILAEIFARDTGFARGLGGSMHAFFTPFGIYPNNAIVGGSADIAMGAALFKKINKKKGLVISNIGDGAMGCGPVWEAMNMAAMDQFTKLWDDSFKGGLPIIFNFFNNQYGMGGQTRGETMAYDMLARVGAGVSPTQLHAERVDGYNPLAVIDAMKRKSALIKNNEGPVLLDVVTYRFSGHSPSDASSYRTKEELQAWQDIDPLITYRKALVEAGIAAAGAFEEILERSKNIMTDILKLSIDDNISPRMDLAKDKDAIASLMFSNMKMPRMDDRAPETLMPKEENPRLKKIAVKERFGIIDGKPVPKNK
ncbi:MAG TPA: thiamine pyrophosphate-dependent dehydrogenase E1 component subunit alpha, partial [Clostridia bacterium]|nr:thiamine pyrophosphate-dependent dehydrogenase E1 component subunit alpha [Clostridia bacterium]